ncbi:MAG: pirin family protein [Acidimicrobiia bacterium]|jgi:redox-sensitive bicupin YhaK (pirin superfamily)|nr:pirin family protein [Acidimicrobiia bacterium]
MTEPTLRPIDHQLDTVASFEGNGFAVRKGLQRLPGGQLDPFLHLDELVRTTHAPGEALGTSDHPHRGFETVTQLIEGAFVHRDSLGNGGRIDAGDVQWMTAGDGIVHREEPAPEIVEHGGTVWGYQLWVNLPRAQKRVPARYQSVTRDQIPEVRGDGTLVRVVAGEHAGLRGPAVTRTPVGVLWVEVEPGRYVDLDVPAEHNTGFQVFAGGGWIATPDRSLDDGQVVTWRRAAGTIRLGVPSTASAPLRGLFLSGLPLGEPVARYGPFVMNTRAELVEAVEDTQAGRLGRIPAEIG